MKTLLVILLWLLLAVLDLFAQGVRPALVGASRKVASGGSSYTGIADYTPTAWFYPSTTGDTNYSDALATDDNHLKSILDRSGNGNHLTGGGASASLKLQNSVINSLGVYESGSSQWMDRPSLSWATPCTVFVVVKINSIGTYAYWFDSTNSTGSQRIYGGKDNGDFPDMGAQLIGFADDVTITNGGTYIFAFVFNTTSSVMYKNGASVATGTVGTATTGGFTFGNLYGHANGGGQFGEFIIFPSALNSTQVGNVFGTLNTKFAVY